LPPDIPPDVRDADGFHLAMKDMLPGNSIEGIYWGYVKSWWPYRDDQNVLLLHYSDVRMDLKGNVAKIANFLEVYLSPSELDVVVDRCSMDHMRKVEYFSNIFRFLFVQRSNFQFTFFHFTGE